MTFRETKEVQGIDDVDEVQLVRKVKRTNVSEATLVTSHMVNHVAFYEIHVKGFDKEQWTILRRFHWIKMVYDMLISKGETVKHGQSFYVTTAASHLLRLPSFNSDLKLRKSYGGEEEPSKEKFQHLKDFIEELSFANYQYDFVHKFFAPVRHLASLTITYSRTLLNDKTEIIPFIDPIKDGDIHLPILSNDESDPEKCDLCSLDSDNLKPYKSVEEEIVALRAAVVAIRTKKQRIKEVDTMFLNAFAFRLRELSKEKDANIPVEEIKRSLSKGKSRDMDKKVVDHEIEEAKGS